MHVEVGGLTIAYERAGTRPPVALAHGFVGDGRSTWDSQIEGLADEFTVIAWDAPGAGKSSDPPEGWVARDVVRHLVEWMPGLYFGSTGMPVPDAPRRSTRTQRGPGGRSTAPSRRCWRTQSAAGSPPALGPAR